LATVARPFHGIDVKSAAFSAKRAIAAPHSERLNSRLVGGHGIFDIGIASFARKLARWRLFHRCLTRRDYTLVGD
jgi:hypothetical protein